MAWLSDLAGRAEHLLNNLDESTGAALRNHSNTTKRSSSDKNNSQGSMASKRRSPPPRYSSTPKKGSTLSETKSNYTPSRKSSPIHHQSRSQIKDEPENRVGVKPKKLSPRRISPEDGKYYLNNCPKTMMDDFQGDTEVVDFCSKQKRFGLTSDINHSDSGWPIRMQNLEVENAMLKNELNVMNTEVSQLIDRLRNSEDGNDVVSSALGKTQYKLELIEQEHKKMLEDKQSLSAQLDQVQANVSAIADLQKTHDEEKQRLLMQISLLQDAVSDLESRNNMLSETKDNTETARLKLENELRTANNQVSDLHSKLDKSLADCNKIEKDWAAYKLRVKNMLVSKDGVIKSLQDGLSDTADTRVLMEQLELLKEERNDLADLITRVQSESESLKAYLSQIEARHNAAERVVLALRDALRDERGARNRVEGQLSIYGKELKTIQMETGQTIASLRTALRDKEMELHHIRDSTSSVKTTDTHALNVGDYELTQDAIDKEKIHHLTQTLVQKQNRMEKLLAENNMLKIQLDKLESRLSENLTQRSASHSVVNLQSQARRRVHSESALMVISNRMAAVIRQHPAFRIFIIIYMICLHFWVLTVLLNHTPETHMPWSARSPRRR